MVKIKKEHILIKPEDIKPSSPYFEVIGTFNPGAVRTPNGNIILYVRVLEKLIKTKDKNYFYSPRLIGKKEYKIKIDKFDKGLIKESSDLDFVFEDGTKRLTFISHLRRVILDSSGFVVKYIDKSPSFYGISSNGEFGVEDPRITKIGDLYYMTYVCLSRKENLSTSLAVSKDLIKWERKGIIFGEQDKDVVLFPEKINNKYVSLDRPEGSFKFSPPHIWIAYSDDLVSWGGIKPINLMRKGHWDIERIGAGPPPIKIEKGWLFIYHGILLSYKNKRVIDNIIRRMEIEDYISKAIRPGETLYCAGVALFDLKNPSRLISKSEIPILFPMKKHEISHFENKRVIFPTGLILDENGRDLLIFSGAGDRVTSVKKISFRKIFKKLKKV